VLPCGNFSPAFLGKFVRFFESREKSVEKSGKLFKRKCVSIEEMQIEEDLDVVEEYSDIKSETAKTISISTAKPKKSG
jgi:hypothetical protein